jgi:hypothetical protein
MFEETRTANEKDSGQADKSSPTLDYSPHEIAECLPGS